MARMDVPGIVLSVFGGLGGCENGRIVPYLGQNRSFGAEDRVGGGHFVCFWAPRGEIWRRKRSLCTSNRCF